MKSIVWGAAVLLSAATAAWAQPKDPHIGYLYPSGAKQGTEKEIILGGQYLNGVREIYISGKGVAAEAVEYKKPLSKKLMNDLGQKLRQFQKKRKDVQKKSPAERMAALKQAGEEFTKFAAKLGVKDMTIQKFLDIRKKMFDPKRQPNPQLDEQVFVKFTVDEDAAPGLREVRLKTSMGYSNPLYFHVGQWREVFETEPNESVAADRIEGDLPVIINGQIMPGDVDRFMFEASKGARLVAAVDARKLVPYLADAVPGWFQATVALFDEKGKQVAYEDDYRFHPDPVLSFEVPETGKYTLEIKDAIYRGREDFVYRITLGEVPFVTGLFPLGGRAGKSTEVKVEGWNLSAKTMTLGDSKTPPGIIPVSVGSGKQASNFVPFAMDTLPESFEKEPNDIVDKAQRIGLPLVINGRIGKPGDRDVFRFHGRAGDEIVAEIYARRLDSPLDSILRVTDFNGRQLAVCDDHEDKGSGLTTHHADSCVSAKLPKDGFYYVSLGDTQKMGGEAYAYRLRISPKRPDFALRVVPSTINARPGMTLPLTLYALRKDGFTGDIKLELKDAPAGFILSGGLIPSGQDAIRMTLTAPQSPLKQPAHLCLEGRAEIGGRQVCREAVPAEDMMQAFLYRHLVPTEEWIVTVAGGKKFGPPVKLINKTPVKLTAGGTSKIRYSGPRGGTYAKLLKLELSDPPEGITIEKTSVEGMTLVVDLKVDPEKCKAGTKGNLIIDAFMKRSWKNKGTGKTVTRIVPLGSLPAIPFEVEAGGSAKR